MICDIMPTLSEDGDTIGDGNLEDNNFEQLMVNMLDERDKLMETLRETQDTLSSTKHLLKDVELERNTLLHEFDLILTKCDIKKEDLLKRLSAFDTVDNSLITNLHQHKGGIAEEFVSIAKELAQNKLRLTEKNEEISELKAERNNTKLLLEHLESLVSRHERSLRMTVVKRQAQSSAGVSSEVEVLKALKSLFEHHKALDEKVRERLRLAVEKANNLEEDLTAANQEVERLQLENKVSRERRRNSLIESDYQNGVVKENVNDLYDEISDLKYQLEQRQRELEKSQKDSKDNRERFNQLEEQVSATTKKANFSFESSQKIMKELEEALAQKLDIEDRMMTLEKRYVRSQNDLSSVGEELERLQAELLGLQTMLEQRNEKIENLQEQCKFYEMKFSQTVKHVEENSKIQEELENRKAALDAAEERNFTAEEKLQSLQVQIEDLAEHLTLSTEREKLTEQHNLRLQSTVDKLMSESNDQLQKQVKERMQSLNDKSSIAQQLEKTKLRVTELQKDKEAMASEIGKLRDELILYKNQSTGNVSLKSMMTSTTSHRTTSSSSSAMSSPVRNNFVFSPLSGLDDTDSSWQKMNQANVISNVSKALNPKEEEKISNASSSSVTSIISDNTLESLNSNDAQKLASILQNQLDAINEELELLQVEHRTTERLTEEIEKRVGSETNSLDGSVTSSKDLFDNKGHSFDNDEKKILEAKNDPFLKSKADLNIRRNSEDINESFGFTSHDPLDTKPLMLKPGRSQELLNDMHADTPSLQTSTGSDGSEKSKLTSTSNSWSLNTSYERENYFDFSSTPSSMTNSLESLTRRGKHRGFKTSLGKIFSAKGKLKPRDLGFIQCEELDSNSEAQRDAETRMKRKLLDDIIASGASFATWNAPAILAWLEMWVKLPEWYIHACRANVKSGSIMSALSDYEIQHEIGVNNPLHRLKLRLAIHEMVSVTSPISPPAKTSLVFGDMNHFWIASEWLASLGLPQYRYPFIENLVDARMLEHISKKEYTKYLKVIDGFHRTSLTCGTKCLEVLNYDRKLLEKRRKDPLNEMNDVLVWSNARAIKWVASIGLEDFADFLRQSGVHGAVIAFDETFDADTFAYYLQIPNSNEKARSILSKEYNNLLLLCHEHQKPTHTDMGEGDFRRTKSWRKKFKKDKTSKEKMRKEDVNRRLSGGSDGSVPSSGSSEVSSPSRRLTKSPILDRRQYSVRGGIT